jgi:hypothetical protein
VKSTKTAVWAGMAQVLGLTLSLTLCIFPLSGTFAQTPMQAGVQPPEIAAPLVQGPEVEPVIGGRTVSCSDFRGVAVRTSRMDDLGDVARAWVVSRMPIISIDSKWMATLPDKMQLFFYFHECGHHFLGHIYVPTTSSENEADCWAVKRGRRELLFSREDVISFAPVFAHSKGSKAGHLPGPERAAHLLSCFDNPTESVDEPDSTRGMVTLHSLPGDR